VAWDQISTIINRLTNLAELTNPLDLANAIEEVIRAVEDPVPGDAAELRTLAGAFILAGLRRRRSRR
jgi:hypothetical protein